MNYVNLSDIFSDFCDLSFTIKEVKDTFKRIDEKKNVKPYDSMSSAERMEDYFKSTREMVEKLSRHY